MDIIESQLYYSDSDACHDAWKWVPDPFPSINASVNADADADENADTQCE